MTLFRSPAVGFYVSKVIPAAMALVLVPVWIRLYGASGFGQYAAWLVAIQISSALSSKWLPQAELRFSGLDELSLLQLKVPRAALLIVAVSIVGGAVVAAVSTVLPGSNVGLVLLGAGSAAILSVYTSIQSAFQRRLEVRWYAVAETLRSFALAGVSIGLWFVGVGALPALLTANAAAYALGAVILIGVSLSLRRKEQLSHRPVISHFFSFGWPLAIWAAIAVAVSSSDRLLAGILLDPVQMAEYSWVSDFAVRAFTLLIFPVTMYVHPLMMSVSNSKEGGVLALYHTAMRRILVAVVLLTVVGGVTLNYLALPIFGNSGPGLVVTVVLFFSAGLWQMAQVAHKLLEIEGRTVIMLVLVAASCLTSFCFQVFLSGVWGPLGLAAGLACGPLVYCLSTWVIGVRITARERL